MSSELDRVFAELARILGDLAGAASGRSNPGPMPTRKGGISIDLSLRVRDLDEFLAFGGNAQAWSETQPLIDVFEGEHTVKVLVLLPGIRKEDVSVRVTGNTLTVEVRRGENVYVKELVCSSPPSSASVVSAVENNSVVELVFNKMGGMPSR
jgi:hypothetical protein